jgi:hypothetical protein
MSKALSRLVVAAQERDAEPDSKHRVEKQARDSGRANNCGQSKRGCSVNYDQPREEDLDEQESQDDAEIAQAAWQPPAAYDQQREDEKGKAGEAKCEEATRVNLAWHI